MIKKSLVILLLLVCVLPFFAGCNNTQTNNYEVTFMTASHITSVSDDVTVFYQKAKTVTVEKGGYIGSQAPSATYGTGKTYVFAGWYTEQEYVYKWDLNKDQVNTNITLYAKYTKK